jgi:Holliday junction resolvasome RuvABC endonuclease subunit
MNYMSVDQSSNVSGYCVTSDEKKLIAYGIINLSSLSKQTDQEQAVKRSILLARIDEIVKKYDIKMLITEGVYFQKNPRTHKILAQFQSSLQDFALREKICCFSWENAGEWRAILKLNNEVKRENLKEETKKFVIETYGLTEEVLINKGIDKKYHSDIFDAVGSCSAYFKLLELKND